MYKARLLKQTYILISNPLEILTNCHSLKGNKDKKKCPNSMSE